MYIKKGQLPIILTTSIAVLIFSFIMFSRHNYEFILYIGVIIFFFILILLTNKKVNLPNEVVWGLSIWAILHMAGGALHIFGIRLYDIVLINIVGDPYDILRFDQILHIYGFAVATITMFYIIQLTFKKKIERWSAISVVVIMAGLGCGALNEVIEFLATIAFSSTGVGGYINNSLDLVANLIGACLGMIYIRIKEKKPSK